MNERDAPWWLHDGKRNEFITTLIAACFAVEGSFCMVPHMGRGAAVLLLAGGLCHAVVVCWTHVANALCCRLRVWLCGYSTERLAPTELEALWWLDGGLGNK